MSKATNNTQRVTFGKAQATYGFRSERIIFLDGHNVGTIEKEGKNCGYNVSIRMEDEEGNTVRAFDRCFDIEHDGIRYDNPSIALRQAKGYVLEVLSSAQVARTHVKACGNAGFSWVEIAEEPAQAETVEATEEPAQAFAPGDAVIATYKGAQTRGVIVCEYVCPDRRKGYPDERFYSSPEDPVYVVQERGEGREIAYRASHLKRCLEAHA